MSQPNTFKPDPKLDLVLERVVDLAPEKLWKGWTTPEILTQWFTPPPWTTTRCEVDLRPGGRFFTVMRSPDGQEHPNTGCYLEVIENRKLVWTDSLLPDFRPAAAPTAGPSFHFTAVLLFEPQAQGTKFTAIAMHQNEGERKRHEEMGFYKGWGIALDQLVSIMKRS